MNTVTTDHTRIDPQDGAILVVGGCGYIGSHMVAALLQAGHRTVVLDDLSAGHADALLGGTLVQGDFGHRPTLDALLQQHRIRAVLHFAGLIQVGESMRDPLRYHQHNVARTLTLLEALRDHGVQEFIFSSTAAVYGNPRYVPLDEAHPCDPINPYGASKWTIERVLADCERAHGLRWAALRYFNAAGADPLARIGERHDPETHLIPLALQAVAGQRPPLQVFGRDYDTPDGTCIRDYVHVNDLADAHLLALQHLWQGGDGGVFNLGNGQGFSVQQVLDAVATVTGQAVPVQDAPRRAGDPPRLVADATRAQRVLGWQPRYPDLPTIVRHAWAWQQKAPLPTRS